MADFSKLAEAMADLLEDEVNEVIDEVMADGGSEAQLALEACQAGMDVIGERFESGEYFVGDLIYSGELMTDVLQRLRPALAKEGAGGPEGTVVLCTVKGDLHDIGKNIVRAMLEAGGLDVVDLGIDVEPEEIVRAVHDNDAKAVALSGVLTLSIDAMKNTIDAITDSGMRDLVKVIIGGNPVNESVCEAIGADEWAHSPQKTVSTCQAWCA